MEWDLSPEQRQQLRGTINSRGWAIWERTLQELEGDSRDAFEAAENAEEWRVRKGYLLGVRKVRDLAEVLLTVAEEGREEWIQRQIREAAMEAESLKGELLGRQEQGRRPAQGLPLEPESQRMYSPRN